MSGFHAHVQVGSTTAATSCVSAWCSSPPAARTQRSGSARPSPSSAPMTHPRLPALLHRGRPLQRPRRGHAGPWLLHRILPALRPRPCRLRGPVRGEAGSSTRPGPSSPSPLGGPHPARPSTGSAPTRRWNTTCCPWIGVGGTPESVLLRRIRLPDHLRDHRRTAAVLRPAGEPLHHGAMAKYGHPMQQVLPIHPATLPRPTRRRGRSSSRTGSASAT